MSASFHRGDAGRAYVGRVDGATSAGQGRPISVFVPTAGGHSFPNSPSNGLAVSPHTREADLLRRLERHVIPEPNSGCWLWTGTLSDSGYAQLKMSKKGTKRRAHRIAYELAYGPIPTGMFVCHKCDVRSCVNPAHLFAGTHADNMRDMSTKGRWKSGVGSPQIALSIRNADGAIREIADRFGVHSSTVHNIKRRKYWGHI